MGNIEILQSLSTRASKEIAYIRTEKAAMTAMAMPFFETLGFNVFDPTQTVQEFFTAVGEQWGGEVDYAILREREPDILVECK